MTPEQAVKAQYGVNLGPSPADGMLRAFRIDQFRNGYLLKLQDAACFGSIIDRECFIWRDGDYWPVGTGIDSRKDNAAIQAEWLVWHIAKAAVERGDKLNHEDAERLKLAVQRLEAWL